MRKGPGFFPVESFSAPRRVAVGVIRKMDDITKTSSKYESNEAPHFAGKLNLYADDENTIVDRLGAIAKSEVYFDRPTDLSYFLRNDQKKEKPNVFSPFWQARLVKTSDTDRLIAMAPDFYIAVN